MSQDHFYITTAISYVNGKPHLGHAYEAVLTDVMARYKRLCGVQTYFLTGTDEHGEKVAKTAEKNGATPLEFADQNAGFFKDMATMLNLSHDDFIRTTEPRHYKAAQSLWNKLYEKGDIYLGHYEGWYSVREEAYFTESELKDDPNHKGQKLSPNDTEVEWVQEESFFFRLSNYADALLKHYEDHPEFIQPQSRRNEIISFVKGGLKDLSVSRNKKRLEWGILVPPNNDTDEEHVMYVWLDALTNYITALGYPDTESERYSKFWPADYHVIGKDIIRFHCVYWPAFLMSAGLELPKTVFAHGFINIDGQKMSKSIGNVLSPEGLVETYTLDGMRYLLMREIPHGQDGNFSHEHAVQRINSDLANGIGNLAQRVLSMVYKNCDAQIPEFCNLTEEDKNLLEKMPLDTLGQNKSDGFRGRGYKGAMDNFEIHKALEIVMSAVAECDSYIDSNAPWTLKKNNEINRMNTVLYVLSEVIRKLAILMLPVTPGSAHKILDQINIPKDQRLFEHISTQFALKPGQSIEKPEGVFPRIIEPDTEEKTVNG